MAWLFAFSLFVSSALLFLIQPMIGRMVLPLLGGTPSVWNTCLVFFQATLLAGYAYAHALPGWLGERRHVLLHLGLLLLPLAVLPVALPHHWAPPDETSPVFWLFGLLLMSIGLPFFVVATSSPLLQRWFAASGHPSAHDPYFLYAASNLGSLTALLGYPLLVEPLLTLEDQSRLWMAGYGLLLLLTARCAFCCRRTVEAREEGPSLPTDELTSTIPPLGWKRRLRWLLLAFVPSSLMLSVTTYLSTDIAAMPLLWVAPLGLYLLTFVLAFARKEWISHAFLARWMPLVVLMIALVLVSEATEPIGVLLALHLLALFWISLLCHSTLVRDRPPGAQLTEFYLWLSAGGVLGGLFNALLAPLLFKSVVEYPVVLVLACLLRPAPTPLKNAEPGPRAHLFDFALPAAVGCLTAALIVSSQAYDLEPGPISIGCMFALPMVLCYTFLERPIRFALGIGAVLLASSLYGGVHGRTLYRARSFFGVHRVTLDPTGSFRMLVHGNTLHGQQSVDPARAREPLTYYTRKGPIGEVFAALHGDARLHNVAIVGLGTGALTCYAEPGQHWTYYEIDPAVVAIARDSGQFTFFTGGPVQPDLILGDARRKLVQSTERYGLLVIDAFSSDSIPIHLLTREALQIYLDHLSEDGLLVFNISNRYLDLERVLADLACQADPPLVCLAQQDLNPRADEKLRGAAPSHWLVLARQRQAVAKLLRRGSWRDVPGRPDRPVWTDDYSNLLGVLKWE
jgi:hypothetical protein